MCKSVLVETPCLLGAMKIGINRTPWICISISGFGVVARHHKYAGEAVPYFIGDCLSETDDVPFLSSELAAFLSRSRKFSQACHSNIRVLKSPRPKTLSQFAYANRSLYEWKIRDIWARRAPWHSNVDQPKSGWFEYRGLERSTSSIRLSSTIIDSLQNWHCLKNT